MEQIIEIAKSSILSQIDSKYTNQLKSYSLKARQYLYQAYKLKSQLENQIYENKRAYLNNSFQKIDFSQVKSDKDFRDTVNKMMAYTRWQAAKDIVYSDYINRKLDSSIEGLMKNAYTLVEEIGAITTGHNPTYHIVFAVGRGKSRKIYEGDLPLSSLMQAAQLQPVWKNSSSETSFKLRLVATEEIRKQWATQSSIVALDETALKEYTSIMDEISNLTYGNGKRITNEGNKFEIYRKYLIQKQDNKDKNLLSKIAQEVMSNTKSFAKGQDFEYSTTADKWLLSPSINLQEIADQQNTQIERYESLKSFMGSNPSLASLSTLISTLENICSTLEIDISGIQNKAQMILNSEIRADGSLQAMLKEEIEERLREELNQIFQ